MTFTEYQSELQKKLLFYKVWGDFRTADEIAIAINNFKKVIQHYESGDK